MMNNVSDRFDEQTPPGRVIGQGPADGVLRRGVDVEGVISIDHQALRIQPLRRPGWGRAGLAYGPFPRQNGLAFGVHILNGHNTSQTGHLMVSLPRRVLRWVRGSGSHKLPLRLYHWTTRGQKRTQWRQLQRWVQIDRDHRDGQGQGLDENLAVGWFLQEAPPDPAGAGHAFVMHAAGPENGELWCTTGQEAPVVARGVQNIPVYYVVVLREQGAAYYAASLPGARGFSGFPQMRPLAIDHTGEHAPLFAGVQQSVMGQIGFRVDTRVYSAHVAQVGALAAWYGTAHAADRFPGRGNDPAGQKAAIGGAWQARDAGRLLVLEPGAPSGLVHGLFSDLTVGLVWRYQDDANYWRLTLDEDGGHLHVVVDGLPALVASGALPGSRPGQIHALQILDDGVQLQVTLDGQPLLAGTLTDRRLGDARGVGIYRPDAARTFPFRQFEAHPRAVPIPAELPFAAPWLPRGETVVVRDDFSGPDGDLAGRLSTLGERPWQRTLGSGVFRVSGGSLAVQATLANPLSERTAYTIAWPQPQYADIAVDVLPPGSARGEGERGRGGLIFWQDAQNYIIINTWLDDVYEGASISSFFFLNGYEDIFDAVWTNVGRRVRWGVAYRLRVVFDGLQYLAYVNDEPVLYRALTDIYPQTPPLRINRVGLVANWEWGHDTGSRFDLFEGRAEVAWPTD